MSGLEKQLKEVQARYQKIWDKVKDATQNPVKGHVICLSINNKYQYYLQVNDELPSKNRRKYLRQNQLDLARPYAQHTYDKKVYKLVKRRLKQLSILIEEFRDDEIDLLYTNLSEGRRILIKPVEIQFKDLVSKWSTEKYISMGFQDEAKIILTNKGEKVRSKTEKILADKFAELGIAYKYECPIELPNGFVLYPDFTFLSPHTRQEVYWEHHGMMDDPNYVRRALRKIATYERHGILRGQRLIVTYETSQDNLDYTWVDMLIERFLL